MMNNTQTQAYVEHTASDMGLAIAIHDLRHPDIEDDRPEGFVRRLHSPFLTPAHIDVTNRPVRYTKPKDFVFPSRRQMRTIRADRWMRQRFRASKTASYNELSSVHYSIDNREALAPSFRLGATIESIGLALLNATRCFGFNKKIVH